MTEFKASAVAFEVQKSFANKFFSTKAVAKTLIDDTSSHLLDNLYLLLYVFVSIFFLHCNFSKEGIADQWEADKLDRSEIFSSDVPEDIKCREFLVNS